MVMEAQSLRAKYVFKQIEHPWESPLENDAANMVEALEFTDPIPDPNSNSNSNSNSNPNPNFIITSIYLGTH